MLRALIGGAGRAVRHRAGLVLIAALAACSSAPVADPQGEPAEHRFDETSGEESMVITTARGKASMRSGSGVPVRLPRGFSLYPGAAVRGSTLVTHPDGVSTMTDFEAEASGAEIIAHVRGEALAAGYAIAIDTAFGDAAMLSARRAADGATILVSTEPSEGGLTRAQIVVGKPAAR